MDQHMPLTPQFKARDQLSFASAVRMCMVQDQGTFPERQGVIIHKAGPPQHIPCSHFWSAWLHGGDCRRQVEVRPSIHFQFRSPLRDVVSNDHVEGGQSLYIRGIHPIGMV